MLLRLKQSKVGYHISNNFCSALGYADDVSLLCPSLSSLRMMLRIADDFGSEYNVPFNLAKYELLVYGDNTIDNLTHNGSFIKAQSFAQVFGKYCWTGVSKLYHR